MLLSHCSVVFLFSYFFDTLNTMPDEIKPIADEISYHPKRRMGLFRALPLPEQGAVFEILSPHIQQEILEQLDDDDAVSVIDQLDLWQAKNVLAQLKDQKHRERIIAQLKGALKEKAEYFLRFHPKAAMTLLNFNYIFLSHMTTIDDAATAVDRHYRETGKFPEILVHLKGRLLGEVPPAILIREDNASMLHQHTVPVKTVAYLADIQEIVDTFAATRHSKVAVLDKDGSVLGVIYSDDALRLFEEEPAAELYDFAGVAENERPLDSVWSKVRHRYKWLIINLGTAFLAAAVVGLFRNTIDHLVLLAIYMPIVAGMGGNAATQTLAVVVRGIAMGEVRLKNGGPAILREVGAGFVNGIITGVIVALVATLWNKNPLFGFVIGSAIVFNLVIAGFFGAFIPLVMKKMGKDPATSATIFITTATDVFGFFAFLGLATLVLL